MEIQGVVPSTALPGGLVRIAVTDLAHPGRVKVEVGGVRAEVMGASSRALSVRIPETIQGGLSIFNEDHAQTELRVGRAIARELHPVANPVVDAQGNVYVTYSGARGEKVPFSVYVIQRDGQKDPFLAEVMNPTGLAIGPDNHLYITSRHTGAVYRSSFDKQVEKYVDGLGLATGLAFDSSGSLLVGDRGGKILKISPRQEISVLCELEPSVSAFHLAINAEDDLFVAGPTLATQDSIYRVAPGGEVSVFFKGMGRPQGLGFDPQGNLQVAASFRGRKGLYTFIDGQPRLTVSGPMLVGFAYNREGSVLYCADHSSLFRIDLGLA